ncbi:MAG: CCA tRNA nucleotidyltransferase [Candidatus Tectimicrobiota bacterium]
MIQFPASLAFVHALQQQGAVVYMVGGTVRDELLGRPRKDLDLLVSGLPQPVLIRALRPHGRLQLTGRAFGVIKFLPHGWEGPPVDIALPRREVSTGIGHRDFAVTFDHTLPIEADLGRRDFTINAMAINLANGQLLDPFAGHHDLQQRLLRQVSPQAFPEDPLRMLRGIQLAARFGLHIEAETRAAMCLHAATISSVAAERIAEELRKLLQATSPSQGFRAMQTVGLLEHLIPELARTAGQPAHFSHTLRRLDAGQQCPLLRHRGDLDLLLSTLFWDSRCAEQGQEARLLSSAVATAAQQRLLALKVTTIGAHPDLIAALLNHMARELSLLDSPAALRHFASEVGLHEVSLLWDLHIADQVSATPRRAVDAILMLRQHLQAEIDRQAPLTLKALAINGHDLQQLGVPAGPQLGQLLQHLLSQVLDEPQRNTRSHLLTLARQFAQQPDAAPAPLGQAR